MDWFVLRNCLKEMRNFNELGAYNKDLALEFATKLNNECKMDLFEILKVGEEDEGSELHGLYVVVNKRTAEDRQD